MMIMILMMMIAMRIDLIDPLLEHKRHEVVLSLLLILQDSRGVKVTYAVVLGLEEVRVVDEPRRQEKTRSRGFKGSESKVGDDGDDRN